MKKDGLTYLAIASLLLSGRPAVAAVTDPVENVINEATYYISEAGTVQSDLMATLSGKINDKIGNLGDTEALQKKLQKAENLKKKVEKLKKAQERLGKFKDKAGKLVEYGEEKLKKAQELADKAKAKYEEAKAYAEEKKAALDEITSEVKDVINDVNEFKDDVNSMKNDIESGINDAKEGIAAVKETASAGIDLAKSKVTSVQDKVSSAAEKTGFGTSDSETVTTRSGASTTDSLEDITPYDFSATEAETTPIPSSDNQNSASEMINAFATETRVSDIPVALETLPTVSDSSLSAGEVLSQAQTNAENPSAALPEEKSSLSLEEQLTGGNASEAALNEKLKAADEAKRASLKGTDYTWEELEQNLQNKDKEKLDSLEGASYTWEELEENLKAKDAAKRATFKRSSRQTFGRSAAAGQSED